MRKKSELVSSFYDQRLQANSFLFHQYVKLLKKFAVLCNSTIVTFVLLYTYLKNEYIIIRNPAFYVITFLCIACQFFCSFSNFSASAALIITILLPFIYDYCELFKVKYSILRECCPFFWSELQGMLLFRLVYEWC